MAKENKLRKLEKKKFELIRNIKLCNDYKKEVIINWSKLKESFNQGFVSYEEYYRRLSKSKYNEWLKYYDDSIKYNKNKLNEFNKEINREERKAQVIPFITTLIILSLIGLSVLIIKPEITGWVIGGEGATSSEIDNLINETGLNIPKENIKDIQRIGFSGKEITFNNKEKKTLIIHEPILPDIFENIAPLEEKDEFTYTSTLDNTRIEIEFDSEEIKQDKIGKKFIKEKFGKNNSWKINYSLLLPSEDFKPRFKISSNSEIQVIDDYYGAIKTGQFELDFKAERENNFDIEVEQIDPNLVYIYLSQNYSEHNKNINDEILIDPSLSITSALELCGEVTAYDTITINNGGVLQICARNTTAATGYANISLGATGNFTMYSGIIEGQGRGERLGAGTATSGGTATQGGNGQNSTVGGVSSNPNYGGGGGGQHAALADSAGGGGGGFGGAGGWGGFSVATSQKKGLGGLFYSNSTSQELLMGSGGGGGAGDQAAAGANGGAGIKIDAGSGTIDIHGIINISGNNGTNSANAVDSAGGGGGSGGHVILIANTINLSYGQIFAEGGGGGNAAAQVDSCAGGGAGGGRIVYVYASIENVSTINSVQEGGTDWSGTGDNACDDSADAGNSTPGGVGSISDTILEVNDAPSNPTLILNSTTTDQQNYTNETIACNFECSDPDTSDTITYDIDWLKNGVTSIRFTSQSCADPSYNSPTLIDDNTTKNDLWSCSVNITDIGGLSSSTIFSENVTINNYPPSTPDLNLPINNTQIEADIFTVELNWSNVSQLDIDVDSYTYYLEIWNESDALNILYANSSISEAANTTSDLITFPSEGADYFWRVLSNDTATSNSSWSELRNISFYATPANTAPSDPTGVLLNSTLAAQTNLTNENLAANFLCSDPDTLDTLTYDIYFYKEGIYNQSMLTISCTDPEYVNYIFDETNTSKGENWSFSVNVTDIGGLSSPTVFSNNLTIENSAPEINYVSLNSSIAPFDGDLRKFEFSFTANDNDTTGDLDNTKAIANVSLGTDNYLNNSCYAEGDVTGGRNYSCTIEMQYYYVSGSWNYGTEIKDNSGIAVQNSTGDNSEIQTWYYSELAALNLSASALTWTQLIPSQTNQTATSNPIVIENTGNKAVLNIFAKAIDLIGASGKYIPAANFTIGNITSASQAECDYTNQTSAVTPGVKPLVFVNNTNIYPVINALTRGQGSNNNLYYCLFDVPSYLQSESYATSTGTEWDISVE